MAEQGARNAQESPRRAAAWRQQIENSGIKVLTQFWTAGAYDGVLILQGDSEEQVLGALNLLASFGNVRTHSLRAFDAEAFARITAQQPS